MGPGSLYTSVIPNLLVEGVVEAICRSEALKIYVCNIMTQEGETEGYTAADHVDALLSHGAPGLVDLCLANSAQVRPGLVERYREEDAAPIVVDRAEMEDAKVHPEEHPELVVRVAGYSAYFTRLPESIQDEVIERTSQDL